MKLKFLSVGVALMAIFASCNRSGNELDLDNLDLLSKSSESTNFKVSLETLNRYLSLTSKQGKVIPVVEKNDTLAYYVKHENGWSLISGDKSLSPILCSSVEGDLKTEDNIKNTLKDVISYVKVIRDKKDKEINKFWGFFEKSTRQKSVLSKRGEPKGMWVAVDTIYEFESEGEPHIIKTEWNQRMPWNEYTPFVGGSHAPVGCVPLAIGQVLYHYRHNNPAGYSIPTTIEMQHSSSRYDSIPYFSNLSTSGWSNLVKKTSEGDTRQTAIFLSYLGHLANTRYNQSGSSTDGYGDLVLLSHFGLNYSYYQGYYFQTIINQLRLGKPVLLGSLISSYPDENVLGGHLFIVDSYIHQTVKVKIILEWDPEHIITNQDTMDYTQDYFDENEKKDFIYSVYEESYMLQMNWGANDFSYNNIAYTVAYANEPDALITYSPYWRVGANLASNVYSMIYNIRNIAD